MVKIMAEFFATMTTIEIIFSICAFFGSLFFILRGISVLLGFSESDGAEADGALEADGGADMSMFQDLDGNGIPDLLETDALPVKYKNKLIEFSFQNISAFFMMFGLIGLAMMKSSGFGAVPAILAGFAGGVVMAWVLTKVTRSLMYLKSSGNKVISSSIGKIGRVYLRIPVDGTGQVQVEVSGRLEVCDAVSADNEEIKSGEEIQVVSIKEGNVLCVTKNVHKLSV